MTVEMRKAEVTVGGLAGRSWGELLLQPTGTANADATGSKSLTRSNTTTAININTTTSQRLPPVDPCSGAFKMLDIHSFDAVWQNAPRQLYSNQDRDLIHHNRRALGGQLFFDRLLFSLGISKKKDHSTAPESFYPPKTNSDLRKLHGLIVQADVQEHWRASALYYLLRDWNDGREAVSDFRHAEDFATRTYLPEKYRICVEGLWHLDRLNFKVPCHSKSSENLRQHR
jgi:hypothetical protein